MMMLTHGESLSPTPHPRLRHATPRLRRLAALAAFALLAAACQMQPSVDRAETDIQGDGFRIVHLGRANTSSLSYTIDVGSKTSDVYVVFTNPGGERLTAPALRTSTGTSGSLNTSMTSDSGESLRTSSGGVVSDATGGRRGGAVSGTPMLRELSDHARLTVGERDADSDDTTLRLSGNSEYEVGERTELFGLTNYGGIDPFELLPACAASVRQPTADEHGLVVWVEEDNTNETDSSCAPIQNIGLDSSDFETIAEAFRSSDGEPDIYSAVKGIFGAPWGDSPFVDVLPPDQEYIHIFLFDIDRRGTTTDQFFAGYFFANDTIVGNDVSNERLIFYLHGPVFADAAEDSWSITERQPSMMTQTVAHEFQHLINWYQKTVARGSSGRTDVWIDELMSLLAEEYVGELLKSRFDPDGNSDEAFLEPRGVNPKLLDAGAADNTAGRLPLFSYWNMRSVVEWQSDLRDYAASYAFGAWLTRNYGGVRLMRDILDNEFLDERAVTTAVRRHSRAGANFGELLERWGASVVLSDRLIPVQGYRYRAASGFTSSAGGTEVTLGSIDLHNYLQDENGTFTEAGPRYFTSSRAFADEHGSSQPGYSNVYYRGPQGVTGNVDLEMSASADARVTIIIKERLE